MGFGGFDASAFSSVFWTSFAGRVNSPLWSESPRVHQSGASLSTDAVAASGEAGPSHFFRLLTDSTKSNLNPLFFCRTIEA